MYLTIFLLLIPCMHAFRHIGRKIPKAFYISFDNLNHTRYIPCLHMATSSLPPIVKDHHDPKDKYYKLWKFVDSLDDLFLRLCVFHKYDWHLNSQNTDREVSDILGCSEYAVKLTLDSINPTLFAIIDDTKKYDKID